MVGSDNTVSRSTVLRRNKQAGLHMHVLVFKLLISKKNQKLRPQFAQKRVVYTDGQWSRMHSIDESKFNVVGTDGRSSCQAQSRGTAISEPRQENSEAMRRQYDDLGNDFC